jgi:hypothetical protein
MIALRSVERDNIVNGLRPEVRNELEGIARAIAAAALVH